MARFFSFIGLFLVINFVGNVQAATITVAVASNFIAPIKDISAAFEAKTGHKVRLVFGSSGQIFAQIIHGAPFDIFLSADQEKPKALEEKGLTIKKSMAINNSRFTYARGSIIVWSSHIYDVGNLAILKKGLFNKIALANPKLAPYGVAAREVLQSLGLYQALSPKIILGENIAQTYLFIATGNADLGFIARSQLSKDGPQAKGTVWIIPENLYHPILQDGVILKAAYGNQAVFDFVDFLQSDKAKKIIQEYGYKTAIEDQDKQKVVEK